MMGIEFIDLIFMRIENGRLKMEHMSKLIDSICMCIENGE